MYKETQSKVEDDGNEYGYSDGYTEADGADSSSSSSASNLIALERQHPWPQATLESYRFFRLGF